MTPDPDLSGWNFSERERQMQDEAAGEDLDIAARLAIALLADTVYRVGGEAVPKHAPGSELRKVALANLGALSVRCANVAALLVEVGYTAEAYAPSRRLLEHSLRAEELYDDTSGDAARRWLTHKRHTPMNKLIAKTPGAGKLHGLYSRMAHDDRRAIDTLYSPPLWIKVPDDQRSFNLFPQRSPVPATGILTSLIKHVCEIAVRIVEVNGLEVVVPGLVMSFLAPTDVE